MSAIVWLSDYSTALLFGLGALVGLLGVYLAIKHEHADRCAPITRTRYPRRP